MSRRPAALIVVSSSADPFPMWCRGASLLAYRPASPSQILRSSPSGPGPRLVNTRTSSLASPLDSEPDAATANNILPVPGEVAGRLGSSYRHDPIRQVRCTPGTALRTCLAGPERQGILMLCAPDVLAACAGFHSWSWTELWPPTRGLGSGESPSGRKLTPRHVGFPHRLGLYLPRVTPGESGRERLRTTHGGSVEEKTCSSLM